MKDDRLYLIHISECIARIEHYTQEGREAFMASTLVQDAVIRNLQTLAESASRLSAELSARYSEIDWRGLHGFRNVLVHDYLGVDLVRVWQIVERRLPELKRKIEAVLKEMGGPT